MMAWASAELSADYQAWMAANKPLLLGENHVRNATTIKWTTSFDLSATDITAAAGPSSYLHDGYTDLVNTSNSGGTNRYLLIDFGTPVDFDTVAIMGTNFASMGATRVLIDIADDSTFSTNLVALTDWYTASTDPVRRLRAELYHTGSTPRLYTDVQYFALVFVAGGSAPLPEIGELFVGQRRQMKTNPFGAWDKMQLRNRQTLVEAAGGPLTKYVYNAGRRQIRARFGPHEDDTIADLAGLYRDDTSWGEYPFVWCDEPTSNPDDCNMMVFDQDTWASPYNGPQQREFFLSASEQGPDYLELEL